MMRRISFTLLLCTLTVCSIQTDELADSLNLVTRECKSKLLQINSIESFKQFMQHYRKVVEETEKPKRGFLNTESGLRKCFDQVKQLTELEELISDQGDGVCRLNYINKLIDYHLEHIVKIKVDLADKEAAKSGETPLKRTYAAYIFSLLAHQVVLTCKSKLLERVTILESEHECSDVVGSFLPLDIARAAESDTDGARAKFTEFLHNFKRVEDFSLLLGRPNEPNPYYNVVVSQSAGDKINMLKGLCKDRKQYYESLFLPVSSLSQLGYEVDETSVDSHDLNSQELRVLKCWLATAQLCQGILRIQINSTPDNHVTEKDQDPNGGFVEIKFNQPQADADGEQSSPAEDKLPDVLEFRDYVTEFSPEIVEMANKKRSFANRIKQSLLRVKKLLVNHVKVDPNQGYMASHFADMMTRGENDLDSAVAFNGKQDNHGMLSPIRLIADDTDTILATSSFFVSHTASLILNSCVAIGLTAVFILFTVTTGVITMGKKFYKVEPTMANFKEYYRMKLDDRTKKAHDVAERNGWSKKMSGTIYAGRMPRRR